MKKEKRREKIKIHVNIREMVISKVVKKKIDIEISFHYFL